MITLFCWGDSCGYDFDEDGDESVNLTRLNAIVALSIIVT